MATEATPHFDYNVTRAERSLGIHPEKSTRELSPVEFRVGRHVNKAGESLKTLKLLLWATQTGVHKGMTLDKFLPLFAELWDATGQGLRAPSFSTHRNLFELWLLWSRNRNTLVSDVFELMACPFTPKVLAAA
jgi:hypothetical protein